MSSLDICEGDRVRLLEDITIGLLGVASAGTKGYVIDVEHDGLGGHPGVQVRLKDGRTTDYESARYYEVIG